jgi:hypothetical protein
MEFEKTIPWESIVVEELLEDEVIDKECDLFKETRNHVVQF